VLKIEQPGHLVPGVLLKVELGMLPSCRREEGRSDGTQTGLMSLVTSLNTSKSRCWSEVNKFATLTSASLKAEKTASKEFFSSSILII